MKKIISVFSVIVLLIGVIALPVSASDSGWNSIDVRFDNYLYAGSNVSDFSYRYSPESSSGTVNLYRIDVNIDDFVAAARLTGAEFSLKQGDVVVFPDLPYFTGWLGGTTNKLISYSLAVAYFDEDSNSKLPFKVFMRSGWKTNINLTPDPNGNYWGFDPGSLTLTASASHTRCAVILLMQVEFNTEAMFGMNNNPTFTVSYGDPNSPNRPRFEGPDSSTSDELISAEDQLLEDTKQGRKDVASIMSVDSFGTNLNINMAGILAATQIVDLCFNTVTPYQSLIYIGLSLGFVAFVLGTVNMIVGSIKSHDSSKRRESSRGGRRQ